MGVRAFSKTDNPNEVVILGSSREEKAIQLLFQSQEFREATARAGVKVPPEVSYLDEVADLAA